MPTIKTEDLTGAPLDWAVAVALGAEFRTSSIGAIHARVGGKSIGGFTTRVAGGVAIADSYFCPSTNWHQGGPIIDRENIGISPPTSRVHRNGGNSPGWGPSGYWSATTWHAGVNGRRSIALHESSALIAAMRCFVHSKLGESVEIPAEIPAELEQRAAQAAQGGE